VAHVDPLSMVFMNTQGFKELQRIFVEEPRKGSLDVEEPRVGSLDGKE
jgi:hypothetical protein